LHRGATVPLTTGQSPKEGRQPGTIPIAVLRRQLGFEAAATSRTLRRVQHDMRHGHLDLGQLEHLVGIVRRHRWKLPLPTGTALRLDFNDLCRGQQRLLMAAVPRLGAGFALRASTGGSLFIRRIGRRGAIGIVGALPQAGLQLRDPRLQRLEPGFQLLDDLQQLPEQVVHDERGLCPAGGIQREPCWSWKRSRHRRPHGARHLEGVSVVTRRPSGQPLSRALLHLRQGGFRRREPERHLHGAIQLDGSGQFHARLVVPSGLPIELSEAQMTVSLERAHAEFLGQGEGLAVVVFSRLDLRGITPRRDLAEEAQGIRLVTPFLSLTGIRQHTLGQGVRLLQLAGQQLRLPQGETAERLMDDRSRGRDLLQRLREQRHGVGAAPGQGVCRAQGRRDAGPQTQVQGVVAG
jgi:hypothetical protein